MRPSYDYVYAQNARVLEYLETSPEPRSVRQVADALSMSRWTCHRTLLRLEEAGAVMAKAMGCCTCGSRATMWVTK